MQYPQTPLFPIWKQLSKNNSFFFHIFDNCLHELHAVYRWSKILDYQWEVFLHKSCRVNRRIQRCPNYPFLPLSFQQKYMGRVLKLEFLTPQSCHCLILLRMKQRLTRSYVNNRTKIKTLIAQLYFTSLIASNTIGENCWKLNLSTTTSKDLFSKLFQRMNRKTAKDCDKYWARIIT